MIISRQKSYAGKWIGSGRLSEDIRTKKPCCEHCGQTTGGAYYWYCTYRKRNVWLCPKCFKKDKIYFKTRYPRRKKTL